MSWIKQFTVGTSKTINLGNFQNIRIECQLVVEVPEGEDYDGYRDMTNNAQTELSRLLKETYDCQLKKKDKAYE